MVDHVFRVHTKKVCIRVDTKKIGHIHVLLPTLEYSVPAGSPTVPGLTGCNYSR